MYHGPLRVGYQIKLVSFSSSRSFNGPNFPLGFLTDLINYPIGYQKKYIADEILRPTYEEVNNPTNHKWRAWAQSLVTKMYKKEWFNCITDFLMGLGISLTKIFSVFHEVTDTSGTSVNHMFAWTHGYPFHQHGYHTTRRCKSDFRNISKGDWCSCCYENAPLTVSVVLTTNMMVVHPLIKPDSVFSTV
jgi:hypothetical protein